ncbi:MAG: NERD domain-containing protein [Candidatus Obscuribacterales bacterium]|nr:NERD domain-containing protein [Candidatus Obscuribacterales bacterium]
MHVIGNKRCQIYPKMVPNEWRKDPRRRAEFLVYDRLAELPEGWYVFYDVEWLSKVRGRTPEDGQTDFVILHPMYGLLLLEVKGGAIKYIGENSQWTSTDRNGVQHNIKDPFQQVQRSKYALKEKLASIPALRHLDIPFYDCVAFPDVKVGNTVIRPDALPEVIIDSESLLSLEKKLLSILNFWTAGVQKPLREPTKIIDAVKNLFIPNVELRNPLSVQFREEKDEMVRLTSGQFKVLDRCRKISRLMVTGCAGSGKTFLAVEKARRLCAEGYKTLLTCYNKQLAAYLREHTSDVPELEVMTFHQLCVDLARRSATILPSFTDEDSPEKVAESYAFALCESLSKKPELKFDAVVVDEAQDFHTDWWTALDECLIEGANGTLYIFLDDNQNLYRRDPVLPANVIPIELDENIRNTQPIFHVVNKHYSSTDGRRISPRGPAGRQVEKHVYDAKADWEAKLNKVMNRLIVDEQIRPSDVVVLTPRRLDRSRLFTLNLEKVKLTKSTEPVRGQSIACSTIHGFKGLESDVVVITELEDDLLKWKREDLSSLLYTGMSRARSHLIILSSKDFHDEVLRNE